jgi:microcin C transport system substrate-binding protein
VSRTVLITLALVLAAVAVSPAAGPSPVLGAAPVYSGHGLSMYGDLKYGPGFTHFEYADPRARKGGDVRLHAVGTFDTLNPFILKGVAAAAIGELFDTLMTSSADEAFAQYGLVAESVQVPADRSWVGFTLRREARFHDGSPVTVDDIIFSFDTLKKKGHPFYRAYYAQVTRAEKTGERTVKFSFGAGDNRELPLIVGQLPVLSKAYWTTHDFAKTTLQAPVGSGPYRVAALEPGRSITYRRDPTYWGAELPVNVGRFNFDTMRYDYYRDSTISLEAFKAGEYDFHEENVAKNWAIGLNSPAVAQGLIRKEMIRNRLPSGMQGYVFNTRRAMFADPRVRRALAYAFDFEWTNKHLFYGAYTRTESYFANSELAATGLPSAEELKVLEPLRAQVPPEVFTTVYRAPATDGNGYPRDNLLTALRMLREAGWLVRDGVLRDARTNEAMRFEIVGTEGAFERIALPFVKNLERLGIAARVRTVDTAQYQYRLDNFDFDVTVWVWGQSLSPGNEQRDFWSSEKADTPGGRNMAGIKSPAVDRLVDLLIAAPDRAGLIARTRALDRVLLWGHYVIPHWHIPFFRVAYWDKFTRPSVTPYYALGFETWWVDPVKASRLGGRGGTRR